MIKSKANPAALLTGVTQPSASLEALLNDLWLFWAAPMQDVRLSLAEKKSVSLQEHFPGKQRLLKQATMTQIPEKCA